MGGAVIFVLALAGFAIITPIFLCYLCHCFLLVLSDSSAGIDVVRWPTELVTEWWWKPLYCIGLFVFCGLTGGLIVAPFFVGSKEAFLFVYPVFFWLAYPLCIISPLAANNLMMVIHPPLLFRLARHPWALLLVCIVTLPLAVAAAALLGAVLHQGVKWVFPAALVLPPAVLFYARAWGRLSWFVLNEDRPRRRRKRGAHPGSAALGSENPWAIPEPEIPEMEVEVLPDEPPPVEEVEDEWSPHKKPYGVMDEKQAQQEWRKRRRVEQPLEEGYDTAASEPTTPTGNVEKYEALHEKERARKARSEGKGLAAWAETQKPPTFRRALGAGLFGFLFYPQTLQAWLNLALLTVVELLFVCLMLGSMPDF